MVENAPTHFYPKIIPNALKRPPNKPKILWKKFFETLFPFLYIQLTQKGVLMN
jgi:hypothetical protein